MFKRNPFGITFSVSSISSVISHSLCTFSSTCFAYVDLPADVYSWKFYMLIYRFHCCCINIIQAYSFFMYDGFICTKPYSTFAVSEYIRYDSNMLDTAGGEIHKLLHSNFGFLSIFRIFCFHINMF